MSCYGTVEVMSTINERTLVMAIQAVDAEIRRLRALPDDVVVPGDEVLLVDYESAAEDLEEAYAVAVQEYTNLPEYSQLVRHKQA